MQRHPIGPSPKFPLMDKQWVLATSVMLALAVATSANAQTSQVDIVGLSSALSTVAQRHVVRIQPAGHSPVLLMAVQNDGWSFQHFGLLWYRSNDDGATWFYYKDVIAQPDLAVFDQTKSPQTLHLTADLIVGWERHRCRLLLRHDAERVPNGRVGLQARRLFPMVAL